MFLVLPVCIDVGDISEAVDDILYIHTRRNRVKFVNLEWN